MDNFQAGLASVSPTGPACSKGSAARDAEGISAKANVPAAQMVEEGRAAECRSEVVRHMPNALLRRSLMEESEMLAALGSWALVCGLDLASAWPEPGVAGGRWSWAVALVALLLATVFLAADWLPTLGHGRRTGASGGTFTRFLKSRPWALAAHTILLSGCFLWLMLHAAAQRGPQVCVGVATFWTLLSLAAVRLATCAREAATERCKAAGHGIPNGTSEEGTFAAPPKATVGAQGAHWTSGSDHSGNDISGQCHIVAPIVVATHGNVSGCVEVEAAGGSAPSTPGSSRIMGVTDLVAVPASACAESCQTCGSPLRSNSWRQQQRWKPLFPGESTQVVFPEAGSPAPIRPPTADGILCTPPLPSAACPTLAVTRGATSPLPGAAFCRMATAPLPGTSPLPGAVWTPVPLAMASQCSNEQCPGAAEKTSLPSNFKAPHGRPVVGQSLFNDPWQLQASGAGHWDENEDLPLRIRSIGPQSAGIGATKSHSSTSLRSKSPSPGPALINGPSPVPAASKPAVASQAEAMTQNQCGSPMSNSTASGIVRPVPAATPGADASSAAMAVAVAAAPSPAPLSCDDATARSDAVCDASSSPAMPSTAAAAACSMSGVASAAAAASASATAAAIAAATESAAMADSLGLVRQTSTSSAEEVESPSGVMSWPLAGPPPAEKGQKAPLKRPPKSPSKSPSETSDGSSPAKSGSSSKSGTSSPAKSDVRSSEDCDEPDNERGKNKDKEKKEEDGERKSDPVQPAKAHTIARISLTIPNAHNQLEVPGRHVKRKTTPNVACVPVEVLDELKGGSANGEAEKKADMDKSPVASPETTPKHSNAESVASFGVQSESSEESQAKQRASSQEETKAEAKPIAVGERTDAGGKSDAGGKRTDAGSSENDKGKVVQEPTGLKTPDAEDSPPSDSGAIDPEVLRKAVLSNIRRRPVAIGDPIGGARIEELHEILFRESDESHLPSHSAADFDGSNGPDYAMTPPAAGGLDILNSDGMNADSFQKLREHYHSAEGQLPVPQMPTLQPGGASLWPKLLNSIQNSIVHSRNSRRPSFLPGALGLSQNASRRPSNIGNIPLADPSALGSHRERRSNTQPQTVNQSATGSRRGSHANAVKGDSNTAVAGQPQGGNSRSNSRAGSRRGSRMGSMQNSRSGSRAGSRRGSRQASRSNSFVADRRTSLMLPHNGNEPEPVDNQEDKCPSCGNVYMFDAKFCRKCGMERGAATADSAGDVAGGQAKRGSRAGRRKSSLLKVGERSSITKSVSPGPIIQLEQVLEAVAEENDRSQADTRKQGGTMRHSSPRKTAPAAVMSVLTPQVVKRMEQNDIPSGDASAGSPGNSSVVTPSANSPRESPALSLSETVPVSLTINGVEVAESHVTPKAERSESAEDLEDRPDKLEQDSNSDVADAKVEAERLRTALASAPQNMTLKDLFARDSGVGDVSLESLRRVAADWARGKEYMKRFKDDESVEDDSNSDDESSSSSSGSNATDSAERQEGEEGDEDDDDDDEDLGYDPILDQLNLDPGMVSEALKMLMMLNDGFKAHHCNCKEQGPHTCMSPAVSQLASQVQTALHSLDVSLSASLAGSVAVSRRQSVANTRRQSMADNLKARNRRSSGENKLVNSETNNADVAATGARSEAKRSSMIKFKGEQDLSLESQSPSMSGDSKEGSPSLTPVASPMHKRSRRSIEGAKKSIEELPRVEELLPPPPPFGNEKDKSGDNGSSRLNESRGSALLGTRGWRIGGSHVHFSGAEPCGNTLCSTADAGAGPSSSQ